MVWLMIFLLLGLISADEGREKGVSVVRGKHKKRGRQAAGRSWQLEGEDREGLGANNPLGDRRIAVVWTFNTELPYYFELSLATLLKGGADAVDVHVIAPSIPEIYTNGSNPYYRDMEQVFFHAVSAKEWTARVNATLGVDLKYDLSRTHRKSADLKPMLGLLFQDLIPESQYAYWVYCDSDGLYGSFNRLIDLSVLSLYDVVSGFPEATGTVQVLAGTPLRCTGALTILRNSPRINSLFRRAVNWRAMLLDGATVYAFDEHSRPVHSGEEDLHMVLEKSNDVRQCCTSNRQPLVKTGANTVFLAEMMGRFVEMPNSTLTLRWIRGEGLTVNADGHYGFGEIYKNETVEALFAHFLQWKYTCGEALTSTLRGVTAYLRSRGQSPFDLQCLELLGTYKHNLTWRLC